MENERAARLQSALGYFVAARVTISGIAFYLLLGGLDMAFDWSRHVSGHCEDLMDAIALFLAPIALFAGWMS